MRSTPQGGEDFGFDHEDAQRFLTALLPGGLRDFVLEIRFLHNRGNPPRQAYAGSIEEIPWDKVARASAEGWSVTFSPGLRRRRGGKKADVGALAALWGDVDAKRFGGNMREAVKAVLSLPPELHPSALVNSGHGIHPYWFFVDPVLVTDDNRAELEQILRSLQRAIGSDAVHDLCRVMRLPGSVNVKEPAAPKQCRLISLSAQRRFRLEDFSSLLTHDRETRRHSDQGPTQFSPTLPKVTLGGLRVSGRIRELIKTGWQNDGQYHSRSEADLAVITVLRKAGHTPGKIKAVFCNDRWGIGAKYRQIRAERGDGEADRQIARCIDRVEQFLEQERSKRGPGILFVQNASPPDLSAVEEVIRGAFPELWRVALAAMSVPAAMLPDDVVNPPALILEGASAAGKTTVIDMIAGTPYLAYRTDKFSPSSFVTHSATIRDSEIENVDLLPRIRFRCMLTGELAPLFRGREDDLTNNFSILTAVMDGRGLISDSGSRGRRGYEGDFLFSWLGATTPLPTRTWRIMQQLGARLLFCWVDLPVPEVHEIVANLTGPQAYKSKLAACRAAVNHFLLSLFRARARKDRERPFGITWNRADEPPEVLEEIAKLSRVAAQARAVVCAWQDESGNISFQPPNIEQPHRLATLLYNLARGHALLYGRTQLSADDLWLVRRVALDSMPIERRKLLRMLIAMPPYGCRTSGQVGENLKCSRPTAIRLMREMELLDIAEVSEEASEKEEGDYPTLLINLRESLSWLATPGVRTALDIHPDGDAASPDEDSDAREGLTGNEHGNVGTRVGGHEEPPTHKTDPCSTCGKLDWFRPSPGAALLCGVCHPQRKVVAAYRARKRAEGGERGGAQH